MTMITPSFEDAADRWREYAMELEKERDAAIVSKEILEEWQRITRLAIERYEKAEARVKELEAAG